MVAIEEHDLTLNTAAAPTKLGLLGLGLGLLGLLGLSPNPNSPNSPSSNPNPNPNSPNSPNLVGAAAVFNVK